MAKKSKKVKTPKVKGGSKAEKGGGKDPVTGLYLEFYLDDPNKRIRFDNDKTYSKEELSLLYSQMGITDATGQTEYEWEVCSKFIVGTSRSDYTVYSDTGVKAWDNTTIERTVYSGDFSFNKGKLSSATLTSLAEEIITLRDGRPESRFGFIHNAKDKFKLPDASSAREWESVLKTSINTGLYTVQANYEFAEGQFYEGSTSDQNSIARFGDGRFFQEGWWNDPFTPNLI